jgi:uncharacterized protein YjbI with pentapeptide repeats
MANPDHLDLLRQGVETWRTWRAQETSIRPNLSKADLSKADLSGANLRGANLRETDLSQTDLSKTDLSEADLRKADLSKADLSKADLRWTRLSGASLRGADLRETNLIEAELIQTDLRGANLLGANLLGASLQGANLHEANLHGAKLHGAKLYGANLIEANFRWANLSQADLGGADLREANLRGANLSRANLRGANLAYASLDDVDITDADLTGARIYGVSAWGLRLSDRTRQRSLIITKTDEPEITVDNIEVAHFIYLLLHNQKIRQVIDTITSKMVLILGRFAGKREQVLDVLRDELRKRDYLPVLFDFEIPETRTFNETILTLALVSRFIIVDITSPASAPVELSFVVPQVRIPILPILEEGEAPFAMFKDLRRYPWVLSPVTYRSVAQLAAGLGDLLKDLEVEARRIASLKASTRTEPSPQPQEI